MAAPPARARADYDHLIKLLLIGDSGNFLFSFSLINSIFFGCFVKMIDSTLYEHLLPVACWLAGWLNHNCNIVNC